MYLFVLYFFIFSFFSKGLSLKGVAIIIQRQIVYLVHQLLIPFYINNSYFYSLILNLYIPFRIPKFYDNILFILFICFSSNFQTIQSRARASKGLGYLLLRLVFVVVLNKLLLC